jgi:hypothetical protein
MGTSDQRSGRGAAGSMDMISRRSSFCSRLEPKSPSPPPPEGDVDGLRSILKLWVVLLVPLVIVFRFLVHGLLVLLATAGIAESPPEVVRISCRMIGTWMPWAFLLQELLEFLLHCRLLASRGTIHSRDEIIWLALLGWTRIVPLALVVAVIMRMPQIAILAPREPLPHLFLLLELVMHHVTQPYNSLRPVPPEVSVDAWIGDAVVEAVDDVLLRDIRDGGTDIEETACVGS